MPVKILISIVLAFITGFLIYKAHEMFVTGMHPLFRALILAIPLILFVLNTLLVAKIAGRKTRVILFCAMVIGVLLPLYMIRY